MTIIQCIITQNYRQENEKSLRCAYTGCVAACKGVTTAKYYSLSLFIIITSYNIFFHLEITLLRGEMSILSSQHVTLVSAIAKLKI